MDTIHVGLCIDEQYAQHAGVTIESILYNKKSEHTIIFHIISDSLSSGAYHKLKTIAGKYDAEVVCYGVDSTEFDTLPVSSHISKATYYRLVMLDVLPASIEKILYLDVDLIVRADITELWKIDLAGYVAGAVVDIGIEKINEKISLREILDMPPGEPYFNAGVLLINAKQWREDLVGNKLIKYINDKAGKVFFADQDALNAVIWGKWLAVHPKWNVYRSVFRLYYKLGKEWANLRPDTIQALKEPAIVHFTGARKPWKSGCTMPYVNEYYFYLSRTPWKDYKPPNPELRDILKTYRWKLRRAVFRFMR